MVIALAGIEHNTGTTHLALAISNYLCSKLHKRVAYLELNSSNEISAMCHPPKTNKTYYNFKGVSLYPNVTLSQLSAILACKCEYFVLDYGVLNLTTMREFNRADCKLILGCCSPWKQNIFQAFYQKFQNYNVLERATFVEPHYYCVQKRNFYVDQTWEIPAVEVPFIANPFHFTALDLDFFKEFFEEILFIPQTHRRFL